MSVTLSFPPEMNANPNQTQILFLKATLPLSVNWSEFEVENRDEAQTMSMWG